MTGQLDAAAVARLVKTCCLFASDLPGERAAAAAAAHRQLVAAGLDWRDILQPGPPSSPAHRARSNLSWRDDAALAGRHPFDLADCEYEFVQSMRRRHSATARECVMLAHLAARLRAQGCR